MLIRFFTLLCLVFSMVVALAQPKQYVVTDSMLDAASMYIYRFQQIPVKSTVTPSAPGGDSVYISAYPDKSLSKEFYTEKLSLFIADTAESKAYWRRMNGLFPLYIINASSQPREVVAEEGSIILIQEALDDKGQWRPIECWHVKDPYIRVRYQKGLEPRSFLEVGVPRYQGDFKTTLRVKVLYSKGGRCLYSNQYPGSIFKSQFGMPNPGQRYLYYLDKALF